MSRQGRAIVELTRTRLLEFWREKEAVFWSFVFPIILALVLGLAFRSKPQELPHIGVLGERTGQERVLERLQAQGWPCFALELERAESLLRRGTLDLLVTVEGSLDGGRPFPDPSSLRYRYDETRPEGRIAFLEAERVLAGTGASDQPKGREEKTPLPGSRYIDFLIPGLIGLNIMNSGLWGVGFSIVMARVNRLLKLLSATPMRHSHYLLSFLLSRLILLVPEVLVLLLASLLLFGTTVAGSWLNLLWVVILGALAFVGLGLLTAIRASSIEAISGWMNLVMLPMWVLSGSFFSYEKFPTPLIPFIKALPLTALNDALRQVMIEGGALSMVWGELLVLSAWCLLTFWTAVKLFRWQ